MSDRPKSTRLKFPSKEETLQNTWDFHSPFCEYFLATKNSSACDASSRRHSNLGRTFLQWSTCKYSTKHFYLTSKNQNEESAVLKFCRRFKYVQEIFPPISGESTIIACQRSMSVLYVIRSNFKHVALNCANLRLKVLIFVNKIYVDLQNDLRNCTNDGYVFLSPEVFFQLSWKLDWILISKF
jgi:hypothetical protein